MTDVRIAKLNIGSKPQTEKSSYWLGRRRPGPRLNRSWGWAMPSSSCWTRTCCWSGRTASSRSWSPPGQRSLPSKKPEIGWQVTNKYIINLQIDSRKGGLLTRLTTKKKSTIVLKRPQENILDEASTYRVSLLGATKCCRIPRYLIPLTYAVPHVMNSFATCNDFGFLLHFKTLLKKISDASESFFQ